MAMRTCAGGDAGRPRALPRDRAAGPRRCLFGRQPAPRPRALWYKGGRVARRQGTGWGGKRAEPRIAAMRRERGGFHPGRGRTVLACAARRPVESRARIAPGRVAAGRDAGAPAVPSGRRAPARMDAAPQKGS
jgi:hypothetical protein